MIGQRKGGFLLPVMLVTACATLAWMVVSLILSPESEDEIRAARPAKVKTLDDLAAELKFTMPPISNYDAILDRPIFSASRRGTSGRRRSIGTADSDDNAIIFFMGVSYLVLSNGAWPVKTL